LNYSRKTNITKNFRSKAIKNKHDIRFAKALITT